MAFQHMTSAEKIEKLQREGRSYHTNHTTNQECTTFLVFPTCQTSTFTPCAVHVFPRRTERPKKLPRPTPGQVEEDGVTRHCVRRSSLSHSPRVVGGCALLLQSAFPVFLLLSSCRCQLCSQVNEQGGTEEKAESAKKSEIENQACSLCRIVCPGMGVGSRRRKNAIARGPRESKLDGEHASTFPCMAATMCEGA
jgi:hypothetical protein